MMHTNHSKRKRKNKFYEFPSEFFFFIQISGFTFFFELHFYYCHVKIYGCALFTLVSLSLSWKRKKNPRKNPFQKNIICLVSIFLFVCLIVRCHSNWSELCMLFSSYKHPKYINQNVLPFLSSFMKI